MKTQQRPLPGISSISTCASLPKLPFMPNPRPRAMCVRNWRLVAVHLMVYCLVLVLVVFCFILMVRGFGGWQRCSCVFRVDVFCEWARELVIQLKQMFENI